MLLISVSEIPFHERLRILYAFFGKTNPKFLNNVKAWMQRWSHFTGQNGGLAKVDSGFDYAANFSSFACVA